MACSPIPISSSMVRIAIVIGGGLGLSAFDLLVPPAQVELARRAIPQSQERLQIIPAQVMSSAVGAAALVWQNR